MDKTGIVDGLPAYYRPGGDVWFRGGVAVVLETTIKLDQRHAHISYLVRFRSDTIAVDVRGKPYAGRQFYARHDELRPLVQEAAQ